MITVIHGEDIVSSRKKLIELIENQKDSEIIRFEGAKLTATDFLIATETRSIISNSKLIIIEQFSSSKKGQEKANIENQLNGKLEEINIIIWEAKELDKTTLNKITGARILNYPLPKLLWRFLDSIGTIEAYDLLSMFNGLIKTWDINFIYAMIIRQWHNLLLTLTLQNDGAIGLTSWQLAKLKRQASSFTSAKLLNSYRYLISIEYKIKSGLTPLSLKEWLDIFFINL